MKEVKRMFINPFDYINPDKIRDKINKVKDLHPDWEKEDLARELVKQKSRICAGAGALSALPGSIPGIGPVFTIIGGTAVDITTTVYFLSELTLEIATVYNRNPKSEATIREALWVISSCFGMEAATVGISKVTVINASKKAMVVLIEKLFTIIGGWLAKRILLKMVPIVGSILNASINMAACKHVGKETVLWYKANPEQDSMWTEASQKEEEDFLNEEEIKIVEDESKTENDIPDENIVFEPMNKEEEDEIDEYIEDEIDEYIEDIYVQEDEKPEIKEEKKTDTNEIKKDKPEETGEKKTDTNEMKKDKVGEKTEETIETKSQEKIEENPEETTGTKSQEKIEENPEEKIEEKQEKGKSPAQEVKKDKKKK